MPRSDTQFKPGEGGRPKGSKNKIGKPLREVITYFLETEFKTIQADFKKLNPRDRARLYTDLLQYGLPKLQATTLEIDFEKMSDQQLDYLIEKIMSTSPQKSKPTF